jgi:hypothetical protein
MDLDNKELGGRVAEWPARLSGIPATLGTLGPEPRDGESEDSRRIAPSPDHRGIDRRDAV